MLKFLADALECPRCGRILATADRAGELDAIAAAAAAELGRLEKCRPTLKVLK